MSDPLCNHLVLWKEILSIPTTAAKQRNEINKNKKFILLSKKNLFIKELNFPNRVLYYSCYISNYEPKNVRKDLQSFNFTSVMLDVIFY